MPVNDLSEALSISRGGSEVAALYLGSSLIWPQNYEDQYFTITALDQVCTISFIKYTDPRFNATEPQRNISYSFDKVNWTELPYDRSNRQIATLNRYQKVYIKGVNSGYASVQFYRGSYEYASYYTFVSSGRVKISGNIMSLIYGDNFLEQTSLTIPFAFYKMFSYYERTSNIDGNIYTNRYRLCCRHAKNLIMPATTLSNFCYYKMFEGNDYIVTAPTILPAETLTQGCYEYMFKDTNITNAPEMTVTALADYCCHSMFNNTLITDANISLSGPNLPTGCFYDMFFNCKYLTSGVSLSGAGTASENCCRRMFDGCESMETVSVTLSSTTLSTRCYSTMFNKCRILTTFPSSLPATTLAQQCYEYMFTSCTSLTTAPTISATTLAQQCCEGMFYGCSSLTSAPVLLATTLAEQCYVTMFAGCTSIITAPELPATTLAQRCYQSMFASCTSLTTAPVLPATTLAQYCYQSMFAGCTALTVAPALPVTSLEVGCYRAMFKECTALTSSPALPAPSMITYCYEEMFKGCSSMNLIICKASNWYSYSTDHLYTKDWVEGVASSGLFLKDPNVDNWAYAGYNGVPYPWIIEDIQPLYITVGNVVHGTVTCQATAVEGETVNVTLTPYAGYAFNSITIMCGQTVIPFDSTNNTFVMPNGNVTISAVFTINNYNSSYLTLKSNVNNNTVYITAVGGNLQYRTLWYSKDQDNWTELQFGSSANTVTVSLDQNEELYFRGGVYSTQTGMSANIMTDGSADLFGNIMSVYDILDFTNATTISYARAFESLFAAIDSVGSGTNGIADISNLKFPATTLSNYCYQGLFLNCSYLTNAGITLPATTLTDHCYTAMFSGCTSLTTAPALPATTLAPSCYASMFIYCGISTTPSILPATTLATNCYQNMFYGCANLTTAPSISATTLAEGCCNGMFKGCTHLTTPPALSATTLALDCYREMFSGCSYLASAPALPATTLVEGCYRNMFYGCSTLTTAPDLLAPALATYCYYEMFANCIRLNYIKCMATDISASNSHTNWVQYVASSGTFVKYDTMTDWPIGDNGIPTNWVAQGVYQIDTTSHVSHGTVTASTSIAAYGETVTLTLTPDQYYEVPSSYNAVGLISGNTYAVTNNEFTMPNESVYIDCAFLGISHNITIDTPSHGTITTSPSGSVRYGTRVDVIVSPNAGYNCTELYYVVSGSSTRVNITRTPTGGFFSMPYLDITIKSTFEQATYIIHISSTISHGTVTANKQTAHYGEVVTLTATPDTDYMLGSYAVYENDTGYPVTIINNNQFIMPADMVHVYATFVPLEYTITINTVSHGSVTTVPSLSALPYDLVTITPTPDTGYYLDSLNVIDANSNPVTVTNNQFTMPSSNVTISATFSQISYSINISSSITNGTVTANKQTAHYGEVVTLTATPDTGYELNGDIYVYEASSGSPITVMNNQFTMPNDNVYISAYFTQIDYTVDIDLTAHGTVSTSATGGTAHYNDQITVTATPDTGYQLDTLQYYNYSTSATTTITGGSFTMPAANVVILSSFNQILYTISIASGITGGTVSVSGYPVATYGDTVTLTVTPGSGYYLDTLTVVGATSGSSVTVTNNQFVMPAESVTVSAAFISYSSLYFTIESLEDNNAIQLYRRSTNAPTITIQWSTNGTTWNNFTSSTSTTPITTLNTGDKMMIKGTNTQYASADNGNASQLLISTKTINVFGNIMSLLYGDNFVGQTTLTADYTFRALFWQGKIVDASNLILPATTLAQYCYKSMFDTNTSLIATPKVLPAMTLANSCYMNMFISCSSLTSVHSDMLPATTLAPYCYQGFLANCTQLVNSPELPASNLANYCYQSMFQGCSNLKSITCLATNISASRALYYWTYQVGGSGTFTKKSGVSYSTGISGIPSGWTVVDV